jgi:hypothetical protein
MGAVAQAEGAPPFPEFTFNRLLKKSALDAVMRT